MSVTQNYFQLFGLTEQFDIDLAQLSSAYRDIQRNTHPDKFAHASQRDQLLSMQYTANVNDAYEILTSPLKRATYILKLRGVDLAEDHSTDMDPEFLMQQIEMREELEAAQHAECPDMALLKVEGELGKQLHRYEAEFKKQLDGGNPDSLNKAAETVKKMQFIVKMQHEVERLEDQLLDY